MCAETVEPGQQEQLAAVAQQAADSSKAAADSANAAAEQVSSRGSAESILPASEAGQNPSDKNPLIPTLSSFDTEPMQHVLGTAIQPGTGLPAVDGAAGVVPEHVAEAAETELLISEPQLPAADPAVIAADPASEAELSSMQPAEAAHVVPSVEVGATESLVPLEEGMHEPLKPVDAAAEAKADLTGGLC